MIESIQCIRLADDYSAPWVEVGEPVTPGPVPTPTPSPSPVFSLPLFIIAGLIVLALVVFALTRRPVTARALAVEPMQVISIEEAGNILLNAIATIVAGAMLSPVVQILVQILKFFLKDTPSKFLTFFVAAGVTVLTWVLIAVGRGEQVDTILGLIQTVASILLAILTSIYGSQTIYNFAVRRNMWGVGWRRTPPGVVQSTARKSPSFVLVDEFRER